MINFNNVIIEPSSYKDSDGIVFYANNKVYRKINKSFIENYSSLNQIGIYKKLIEKEFLFPFSEVKIENEIYLESDKINFISYPYEWSFNQMKEAAIFHLELLEFCFNENISIKDSTPFNIQFFKGKPIFIDILSFEPYIENSPWNGYKQFCEMFLAPLILSNYFLGNWNRELMLNIEGLDLKKVSSILPFKAKFNSLSFFHIIAHSRANNGKPTDVKVEISKRKILSIIKHLKIGINELKAKENKSNWKNYIDEMPYSTEKIELKKQTIKDFVGNNFYNQILDIGANNLVFAELLSSQSNEIISIDNDFVAVNEMLYKSKNILPLHIDISQATPSIGISLSERKSFFERINPDLTMALALIHHLFHSRNIPLNKIAEIFKLCSNSLIIEFISDTDEMFLKIQNKNNKHIYNKNVFEDEFGKYFNIEKIVEIKVNKRYLYFLTKK